MPSRATKRIILDLGVLVALAATLELALRVLAPEYGHKIFDNKFTGSYPVDVNSDGYRGPAQPKEKPPGQLRILALGDSETFGTGVPSGQTWPAQLDRKMKERHPGSVVINGGFEGVGIRDLNVAWNEVWRDYSPDIVVVGLTANMVSLELARPEPLSFANVVASHGDPPNRLSRLKLLIGREFHSIYTVGFISIFAQRALYWSGLLDHRLTPKYLYGEVLAYGWSQGDIPPDLAGKAWDALGEDLSKFSDQIRKTGARLVVVWMAPRFDLSNSWRDNEKNIPRERFTLDPVVKASAIVQRADAKFIDSLPYLKQAREKSVAVGEYRALYVHFDAAHYDNDGNNVVAQAIADSL